MNNLSPGQQFIHTLRGYYLIPHELLHVLAYWLIGKPCEYRWGQPYVRPLAKRTKEQRLFVLLLPFVTCWVGGLFCYGLGMVGVLLSVRMPLAEYISSQGLTWPLLMPLIGTLFIIYSGTAHNDLIVSYNVLRGRDKAHEEDQDPQPQPKQQETDGQGPQTTDFNQPFLAGTRSFEENPFGRRVSRNAQKEQQPQKQIK
jgi:hypothetical protein